MLVVTAVFRRQLGSRAWARFLAAAVVAVLGARPVAVTIEVARCEESLAVQIKLRGVDAAALDDERENTARILAREGA